MNAGDGAVVVGARSSVITVWRPFLLPLQVIVSTARTAREVVEAFDINVCKVMLQVKPRNLAIVTPLDASTDFAPGSVLRTTRLRTARDWRRLVKYVAAGYVLAPGSTPVTGKDIFALADIGARTPRWFDGMCARDMAAHAMFLGGLQHVWFPNEAGDTRADIEALFLCAGLKSSAFAGAECAYTRDMTLSPASMKPPHEVYALLARLDRAFRWSEYEIAKLYGAR